MSLGIDEYGPSTYSDRIAEFYDAWFHPPTDTQAAVDFLADLAMQGPALELAIGTGRIALPLAAKGVEVHGIDGVGGYGGQAPGEAREPGARRPPRILL